MKKLKTTDLKKMSLDELRAIRVKIAEQIIAGGVYWIKDKDGNLISTLDKTDYWKIKELIERKK